MTWGLLCRFFLFDSTFSWTWARLFIVPDAWMMVLSIFWTFWGFSVCFLNSSLRCLKCIMTLAVSSRYSSLVLELENKWASIIWGSISSNSVKFDRGMSWIVSSSFFRIVDRKCEVLHEGKLRCWHSTFESINSTQWAEGRLNLNFQARPSGVVFFESLKHAKISYTNIEFQNHF